MKTKTISSKSWHALVYKTYSNKQPINICDYAWTVFFLVVFYHWMIADDFFKLRRISKGLEQPNPETSKFKTAQETDGFLSVGGVCNIIIDLLVAAFIYVEYIYVKHLINPIQPFDKVLQKGFYSTTIEVAQVINFIIAVIIIAYIVIRLNQIFKKFKEKHCTKIIFSDEN